ncbi:MAG: mannose-1-phosphate guanylyltransferase, partial [Candidatus Margulisbacteria bacterium]|nr:mannose-1-phosphate guanylyltransferase [Candidatus Margulisiibacteriota bacterium]
FVFVLAGGSGTRLAPLSLTGPGQLPKQFLALVGARTMLQQTIDRLPAGRLVVVPEECYAEAVREQCARPLSGAAGSAIAILAEPFGCNTAPAVGLCALYALHQTADKNTVLFFLPADHIMNKSVFTQLFNRAVTQAATGRIVTIGITPDRPETGYGYIKARGSGACLQVDAFVEKPDLPTARQYLAAGNYFWNAGMFVMKIGTALQALERYAPEIYQELLGIDFAGDLSVEIARQYQCLKAKKQNISIDYAVMEKAAAEMDLLPAPPELEWNDVGGWVALAKYYPPDAADNLIINYTADEIQLSGARGLLVVNSGNGILICPQTLAPRAKDIIPGLQQGLKSECLDCRNVAVENQTARYVGVIGLQDMQISYQSGRLEIRKL